MWKWKVLSRTQRTIRTKAKRKGLSLTFKQRTWQDYAIKKQEHNNEEQEHEMCKTNMKANFCYANIIKHEHEKNMTSLWCNIMLKTGVEQTKGNEGSHSYLYPFGDLVQRSFQGGFYVCIK